MKLIEDGVPLADLSIERIARTAGVGKATIYRRWNNKEDLFVDVMRATEPPDPELPGTSMREDLVVLLESLRRRGLASRSSAILHNVYAQMKSSPKIWAAYHATVIAPGVGSGSKSCAADS
ncbi:TetR/AcrR family transcriptional regulator [Streptomyces chiangmaiensis]